MTPEVTKGKRKGSDKSLAREAYVQKLSEFKKQREGLKKVGEEDRWEDDSS